MPRTPLLLALALSVPLALSAAEAPAEQTIRLDVVGGGVLAALCGAAASWLAARPQRAADKRDAPDRQPPLGEDVARTYASKADLAACRAKCDGDLSCIRAAIEANDTKAEDRSVGTHKRIDAVYKSLNKNNRSLGIIIGALYAQGKVPASAIASAVDEED